MTYTINYSKEADRTLRKWKKSNPSLFKKATKNLMDIMQHPRTGLGHPEALVGGNDVTYSRHITAHDRIIYDIYDEHITVLVVQAEEHYNDKQPIFILLLTYTHAAAPCPNFLRLSKCPKGQGIGQVG